MIIDQTWNELADQYFAIKNNLTYTPFKEVDLEQNKDKILANEKEMKNILSWLRELDIKHMDLAFKLSDTYFFEWYLKNKIAKRYSKEQVQTFINTYLPNKEYKKGFNKRPSIIQDLVVLHFNKIIDIYNERMKAAVQYCSVISPQYNFISQDK